MQGIPRRPFVHVNPPTPKAARFSTTFLNRLLVLLGDVGQLQGCTATGQHRSSVILPVGRGRGEDEGMERILGGRLCFSFSALSESLSTRV